MPGEFPGAEKYTADRVFGDQERLHVGNTDRCRTIDDYHSELYLGRARIEFMDLVQGAIAARGECVWADFGSGNGVALRQAKLLLAEAGVDPGKLRTYGYDALPVNMDEIQEHIASWPDQFQAGLVEDRWAPHSEQADVTTVDLPEPADIITGIQLLQWTADPVEVMRNALRQLKTGGIIGMGKLNMINYTEDGRPEPDPTQMLVRAEKSLLGHLRGSPYEPIPGLDEIVVTDSTITATKTGPTPTLDALRLIGRGGWVQAYAHLYTDQQFDHPSLSA